jgi:hypothetical protein
MIKNNMDHTDSVITNINQIITVPATSEHNLINRSASAKQQTGGLGKATSKDNVLSNQSTNSTISTDNAVNSASKRPKSIINKFSYHILKRIYIKLIKKNRYCIKTTTFTSLAANFDCQNCIATFFLDRCYFCCSRWCSFTLL